MSLSPALAGTAGPCVKQLLNPSRGNVNTSLVHDGPEMPAWTRLLPVLVERYRTT